VWGCFQEILECEPLPKHTEEQYALQGHRAINRIENEPHNVKGQSPIVNGIVVGGKDTSRRSKELQNSRLVIGSGCQSVASCVQALNNC
jgi:hypothetical protein